MVQLVQWCLDQYVVVTYLEHTYSYVTIQEHQPFTTYIWDDAILMFEGNNRVSTKVSPDGGILIRNK